MGTDEQVKAQHEKAAGGRFIERYNEERQCSFIFKKQPCPPKPDLIYYDEQAKRIVGIEITDGYPNKIDAKATWDIVRGKTKRVDNLGYSNEELAQCLLAVIEKHCNNHYDLQDPIILLAITRPGLMDNPKDFEDNILPHIKLPDRIQFSDIYIDLTLLPNH